MNAFNRQSLVFALIVLVFVLIGRSGGGENSIAAQSGIILENSIPHASENVSSSLDSHTPTALSPEEIQDQKEIQRTVLYDVQPEKPLPQNPLSSLKAAAVLVKEIGGTYDIVHRDTERRWPLASLTKLMTAVVAYEHMTLSDSLEITDHMLAIEGDSGAFYPHEVMSVQDVLRVMLLTSSNDAADALAIALTHEFTKRF